MGVTGISDVFEDILKDYKNIAINAARQAAKKAQVDIEDQADKYIDEYYATYRRCRTPGKQLKNLIEPLKYKEKVNGDGIYVKIGIKYDPSNIRGIYKSKSKYHQFGSRWISRFENSDIFKFNNGGNGIPDPRWITEQFFQGIHPGSSYDEDGNWVDASITDDKSPDIKMQEFFDGELQQKIDTYIEKYMFDRFMSYL